MLYKRSFITALIATLTLPTAAVAAAAAVMAVAAVMVAAAPTALPMAALMMAFMAVGTAVMDIIGTAATNSIGTAANGGDMPPVRAGVGPLIMAVGPGSVIEATPVPAGKQIRT